MKSREPASRRGGVGRETLVWRKEEGIEQMQNGLLTEELSKSTRRSEKTIYIYIVSHLVPNKIENCPAPPSPQKHGGDVGTGALEVKFSA